MTTLYQEFQLLAQELLAEFGSSCTLTRNAAGTDWGDPAVSSSSTVTAAGPLPIGEEDKKFFGSFSVGQQTSKFVLAEQVNIGDTLANTEGTWIITAVKEIRPAMTQILSICLVHLQ